jgi:hypothetical protein
MDREQNWNYELTETSENLRKALAIEMVDARLSK